MNDVETAAGLREVARAITAEVGETDQAQMLNDFADAVDPTTPDPAGLLWSDLGDASRVFEGADVDGIEARVSSVKMLGIPWTHEWSQRFDASRSWLVLLPIAVTWFAIAQASSAYNQLIEEQPDAVEKPFLLLWNDGMDGRLGSFERLTTVAMIDVGLILLIVLVTLIAHGLFRRFEAADEQAATQRRSTVRRLLFYASAHLSKRGTHDPASAAQVIASASVELRQAAGAVSTLLGEASSLVVTASEATERLDARTAELAAVVSAVDASVGGISGALTNLDSSTDAMATRMDGVAEGVTSATEDIRAALESAVAALTSASTDLGQVTTELAFGVDKISQSTDKVIGGHTNATAALDRISTDLSSIHVAIGGVAKEMASAGPALVNSEKQLSDTFQRVAASLTPIEHGVASAVGELHSLTEAQKVLTASERELAASVEFGVRRLVEDLETIEAMLQRSIGAEV